MATWSEFKQSDPEMAEAGHASSTKSASGSRSSGRSARTAIARLHPVCPLLTDDEMYLFVIPSLKREDLLHDGRYALHSFPAHDNEDASVSSAGPHSATIRRRKSAWRHSSRQSAARSGARGRPTRTCCSYSPSTRASTRRRRVTATRTLTIDCGARHRRDDRGRCAAGRALPRSSPSPHRRIHAMVIRMPVVRSRRRLPAR